MTIHEILDYEKTNPLIIRLHPEGIFWKAYDMSAFLFTQYVRAYTPVKKYSTTLECTFTSIGFPATGINKVLRTANFKKLSDTLYEIYPKIPVDHLPNLPQAYAEWLSAIVLTRPRITPQINKVDNRPLYDPQQLDIINQIRNFNLDLASPLDCVFFLSNLKSQIADLPTPSSISSSAPSPSDPTPSSSNPTTT